MTKGVKVPIHIGKCIFFGLMLLVYQLLEFFNETFCLLGSYDINSLIPRHSGNNITSHVFVNEIIHVVMLV